MSHTDRLTEARAVIARACLEALPPAELGEIVLRPHQRRIVSRAQRALGKHGGCVIAEDVGRGKTFIALALARQWRCPVVIAPAALRTTWRAAIARAGADYPIISHESLSRSGPLACDFDALIVDESHHFRNPSTKRYAALVDMAASVPIVMLSATPLQNRALDLAAQVALFHGERSFGLSEQALASFVIRSDDTRPADMPTVAPPEWIPIAADDEAVLAALLDLPAPPRPLDGGDAGALRTISLVRAWASSRAALVSTLRSRRRMTAAIAQGLDAGRTPTRHETRAWRAEEDVVQLGMAEMLMRQSADTVSLADARAQVEAEDAAYDILRSRLATSVDPDRSRIAALRTLREAHPSCRIIAFSEYASTVSAFFSALRGDAGVGLLTARHARIATGVIPRAEMLARFAPIAQGTRAYAPHDAVTLLLATDLIAEGVNLQDASIVVHLDLPWNPARLAQRVGRVRRPGGAAVVRAFLLAPPARAAVLLAADARLRRKLDRAQQIIGPGFAVLPTPSPLSAEMHSPPPFALASATAEGRLIAWLERWSSGGVPLEEAHDPVIGAAMHASRGWLAALDDGRLIASLDASPTEAIECVLRLLELADQPARPASAGEISAARATLNSWLAAERVLVECGVGLEGGALRSRANAALAQIVNAARRHEQAALLRLAGRIRHYLAMPLPLGAEQALGRALRDATVNPAGKIERLTHALGQLDTIGRTRELTEYGDGRVRLVALIIVGPDDQGTRIFATRPFGPTTNAAPRTTCTEL